MRTLLIAMTALTLAGAPMAFAGDCSCDAKCEKACATGKAKKCKCKDCGCKTGKCGHGKCGKPGHKDATAKDDAAKEAPADKK